MLLKRLPRVNARSGATSLAVASCGDRIKESTSEARRRMDRFVVDARAAPRLREQPEQVGYRHQDSEDHQAKEDAQPELLKHPGRASSSSVRWLPQLCKR